MYMSPGKLKSERLKPENRKKMIESIRKYRSVDDVVAYIFAKIKGAKITADDEKLHCAFYELQKTHAKLLEGLVFSCGDVFPYSNELQTSIFTLQSSGLMEAPNPIYEFYRISKTTKDMLLESVSESFSQEEKSELEKMSEELDRLLRKG